MYMITLEVNQICNFSCRYCYLGEKKGELMSMETALKGLDIAFLNVEHHRDRRLWVDFVGGETLISFNMLKELSEYVDQEARRRSINVTYSITTNGSIMSRAIYKWLVDKRVHIKFSMDGTEEIHNKNRLLKNGQGSYGIVKEKLSYFRQYENTTDIKLQGTHVITKNNYMEFFFTIRHLVEEIGFNVIDSAIDLSYCWNEKELQVITGEWEKIIQYCIYRLKIRKPFLWGTLTDMQKYKEEKRNCTICGVGMTNIYIRTNGQIYGCVANLKSTGQLGDVEHGININRVRNYQKINLEAKKCKNCDAREKCLSKGCIMNHLNCNEGTASPNSVMCFLEKEKQKIWNKYHMYFI